MRFHKAKIQPITEHAGIIKPFPSEHILFSAQHTSGRLRRVWYPQTRKEPPYEDIRGAILLHNTPLIQIQSSGCPTCASLLGAGYGLPEDSRELQAVRAALLQPYHGLRDALERLKPILHLLLPGLYFLTYSHCFPTNGEGTFFWDISNQPTLCQATVEDLYDRDFFGTLPSFPCFLYPSQPASAYHPERVEEFRQKMQDGQPLPPILAFSVSGFISVVLDGHHRACACALEGIPVPCLTISTPHRIIREGVPHLVWPDQQETPFADHLPPEQQALYQKQLYGEQIQRAPPAVPLDNPRSWPEAYSVSVKSFPTFREAGSFALYPHFDLTIAGIQNQIWNEDYESIPVSIELLRYLSRQPGTDKKELCLEFIGKQYPYAIRKAAYEILSQIKEDPQIDDIMVQVLIDADSKEDPIYQIADHYWDPPK